MLYRVVFLFVGLFFLMNCIEKNKKHDSENSSFADSTEIVKVEKEETQNNIRTKSNDTIEIEDNEFLIKATYAVLDYYVINKNFIIDTLSLGLKQNHSNSKQIDTLLTIKINELDTLNYYLAQKSILTDANIYSKKLVFDKDLKVGSTIDDVKDKFVKLPEESFFDNLKIYDFEGFGYINLSFKDSILNSIKFKSQYID